MKLIAGPCVIESIEQLEETAKYLQEAIEGKDIDFYFKASCIKDNRTKIDNYTGVGMDEGVKMLISIKDKFGFKITTDFHNSEDILRYGGFVDLIQIPAYLAQQTSLIKTASVMHKPIHIKKPQFLGPVEIYQPYKKLIDLGFDESIMLTDRGTMLGYDKVFMDPRHVAIMKSNCPSGLVLVDVTHPNKNYPGTDKEYYPLVLARTAIVSGADGIFMETHPNCREAKCDSETMIYSQEIKRFVDDIYGLWEYIRGDK